MSTTTNKPINVKKMIEEQLKAIDQVFMNEIQPIIDQAESILNESTTVINAELTELNLRDFRDFYPHLERDKAFKKFVINNATIDELKTYTLNYQSLMYDLFEMTAEKDNQITFYKDLSNELLDHQEQQTTHIKNLTETLDQFKSKCKLVNKSSSH